MECLEHEDALPARRPNRASQRRGGDNGTIPTNGSLAEFDDMSSGVGTARVSARLFDSSLFSFEEPWACSIPRDPCMSRESTSASISSRSNTSSNSSRSHPACLPFFLNNPTILSPDRLDLFSCYYEDEDTRTEDSDTLSFCELDKDAGTNTILLYPYPKRPCNTSTSWPSANGTFFLPASSASSIASDYRELSKLEDISNHSSPSWPAQSTMPSKTLAESLDQSDVFVSNTYTAGHVAANVSNSSNHWRPKSARSARSSGRSPSPLIFGRLAGRGKLQKAGATTSLSTESCAPTDANTDSMVTDDQSSFENNKRRSQSGASPAPTLTREEFEALPVAIQRKYFSTLERLRFAQSSGMVEGIYHHYDDISHQNVKRRRPRQDRSSSEYLAGRIRRRSLRGPRSPVADAQWHSNLSDKSRKRQFTREEQVLLAKNLRASVILDAADEAIYKIGRRACKTSATDLHLQAPALSTQPSMESMKSGKQHAEKSNRESSVPDSFYDSFRWLDEEDDLDLRLFLDDYHANLRQDLPEPTQEMRPSFRRHLSISKIPFGRASVSSSRPATKDASAPASPAVNSASPVAGVHGRRRSRALSLISPKHAPSASLSSIDPYAAHYQDPEARLKLRVYLASPQKFDEAIEFGFPSTEAISPAPQVKDGMRSPGNYRSRHKSVGSEHMRTFLADEDEDDRIDDDEASAPDPESPKTPQQADKPTIRPVPQPIDTVFTHKPSESYAQAPANSREMTLRMTLTRPDLRADEDQIYGWQQQLQARRRSQTSPFQEDGPPPPASYIGEERSKESIERMLAGIDHWGPEPSDRGVMKRFWNRVRRS